MSTILDSMSKVATVIAGITVAPEAIDVITETVSIMLKTSYLSDVFSVSHQLPYIRDFIGLSFTKEEDS